MSKPPGLRWGVIGPGRAGRARAAAIQADPRAELVWSAKELRGGVDAVAVCSPDRTHPEYVQRGLDAGLHVLCEFPVCRRAEQARAWFQTGRLHVEHIEVLDAATPVRQDATMFFRGADRESFSLYHRNVARLHRVVAACGWPRVVERDRLLYDGFTVTQDFGVGPRQTRWVVPLQRGPNLFLRDQLAATARFLDGAPPYVSDEQVVGVLDLAERLQAVS